MKLESVFKIDGNDVCSAGNFLSFELYESYHDDGVDETVITYFVKNEKVLGKSVTSSRGAAEGSSTVDVSFSNIAGNKS